MLRILRYLSLRFWLVCLLSLPLSFWALPRLTAWLPGIPVPAIVAGIFVLTGLGLGLVLDILGVRRIQTLIREGELWERAGIRHRAEKRYIRAIGIFDSAWISPRVARRSGSQLIDALARFYLTSESRYPGFEMAAALNLRANPGDETLALLWLGQAGAVDRNNGLSQSVLTALADAHYAHPKIGRQLIFIFLSLGRMDFSAKRLYRYFSGHGAAFTPEDEVLRAGIIELMGDDEPGSEVGPEQTLGDLRDGPGQAISDTKSSPDIIRPYFRQGRRLTARGISRGGRLLSGLARAGGRGILVVIRRLEFLGGMIWDSVREKETLRRYLRWGFMGMLGLWLMFFVWNTLSHMLKSTDQPAHRIEVRISKPLTIQVAAYLKQSHADRYVGALKKKGITARVKKTGAGGKTWYLVRVSEFTDKKSAENYGTRLKSQKIIDDFFVSNK